MGREEGSVKDFEGSCFWLKQSPKLGVLHFYLGLQFVSLHANGRVWSQPKLEGGITLPFLESECCKGQKSLKRYFNKKQTNVLKQDDSSNSWSSG